MRRIEPGDWYRIRRVGDGSRLRTRQDDAGRMSNQRFPFSSAIVATFR